MTAFAAIDPGASSGLAIFMDGILIHAEALPSKQVIPRIRGFEVGALVMEMPKIYTTDKAKGNPNKLLSMVYQIGQIDGATGLPATIYTPSEWKGQVPKSVHHARVRAALLPDEIAIWDAIKKGDGRDAVALGMYFLGRTKRGGVRP